MSKQIFLEQLPKRGKLIDWSKSIGFEINFIYEDIKGVLLIENYNKKDNKLNIKYDDKLYLISTDGFKRCKLGSILMKNTSDFKVEIDTIFKDEKRDLIITNRKYIEDNNGRKWKYYQYKCNKCGFDCGRHWSIKDKEYKEECWIEECNLIGSKQSGCQCCTTQSKIVVENINSIYKTDVWMIPFIGEECAKTHTHSSNDKVKVTCSDCGRINDVVINNVYNRHSISCLCKDNNISYPNKFMYFLLNQLNIKFKSEYSPTWISSKKYDYYFKINNKKYIVEMDGEFHYKDNNMSGQTAEESKSIDDYKDKKAKEHGIEVIRIDCNYGSKDRFEYIKRNILKSKKLNDIFNFNNINWNEVKKMTCTNLAKTICELKQSNPNLTTKDISETINIGQQLVRNCLKQGNGIWCTYNSKEESIKNGAKLGSKIVGSCKQPKQVEIFKNGISLGVYPSSSYLQRESEKLFNVKLLQSGISLVCRGLQEEHKGYKFKYVVDTTN